MVWTPSDRLISPTDLYMKKQAKQSPADSQGIIELMHGHMVIIKERAQVDPKPYWIRHWSWRKSGRPPTVMRSVMRMSRCVPTCDMC